MPEYIELELHVGTLVDELRQDSVTIQDRTRIEILLQSEQNRHTILVQSQNPIAIGERERPEYIEPEERILAGIVLPLRYDSRIGNLG